MENKQMITNPLEMWCKIKCIKDNETCIFETTWACPINRLIIKSLYRRQQYHKYRYEHHTGKKQTPDINLYREVFGECLRKGFLCCYCEKKMNLPQPGQKRHFRDVWTIDYVKSIQNRGENKKENLVICCKECNDIKGIYENTNNNKMKHPNINNPRKRVIYDMIKKQKLSGGDIQQTS